MRALSIIAISLIGAAIVWSRPNDAPWLVPLLAVTAIGVHICRKYATQYARNHKGQ